MELMEGKAVKAIIISVPVTRDSGGKTGRTDSGYRSGSQYCSVESVFWQSSGCVGDY